MDRERVIVYIDENTDDGMMWEELNQEGQMQVSVYDEELEYDVEYQHSIVVKSLQEHLADYTKQVRKEVCEEIRSELDKISGEHTVKVNNSIGKFTCIPRQTLEELLDQIQ